LFAFGLSIQIFHNGIVSRVKKIIHMNSKERILAALNCEQPDRVPVFDIVDDSIRIKIIEKLGIRKPSSSSVRMKVLAGEDENLDRIETYCLMVQELALDATWLDFSRDLESIDGDYCKDHYGNVFRLSDHGQPVIVEGAIKDAARVKNYDMAANLKGEYFAAARHIIDRLGPRIAHFMSLPDPFKESWYLRGGMENLLLDYYFNPDLVHALARIATDYGLAVIDVAAGLGVDGFIMGGDLAGGKTLLISPDHFRQYIKPYHAELVAYAHEKDLKIVKHSDGNVWMVLDDLVELDFDGFHPVQPQCMDIEAVKRHLAGKTCVLGNIDCQDLLPSGTQREVDQAVKDTIKKAAPGGGYILTSSNSIHPGCKPENFIAMVRAAHAYGKYAEMVT
jgi:uroporphyrinogen decarboxylase